MNTLLKTFVLLTLVLSSHTLRATVRKVFFIGNSYTYSNSMPDMFRDFASAKGDTLVYAMSAPGGHTFQQHTTNATTITGIFSQAWDVVVLQEQSQRPSFPPAQVAADVYPYATRLDSFIHANDTCTQTMFMMTWGRRNGDAMNCPGYPAVCTYEGMQVRLRESYMQMMQDNNAIMAPMGSAWKIVIDSFPAIDLYQTDSSHPSVAGSYLQACVMYASVFHRNAKGCSYLGGLSATTAQTLQRIADKVVHDSLTQWAQYGRYPYPRYSYTQPVANTITFSNQSYKAASYHWAFGDGSTDTAANPSHTYLTAGVYTVSFTASNDCFTITRKDTIHVGIPTGIQETSLFNDIKIAQSAGGKVTFLITGEKQWDKIEVMDINGSVIRKYTTGTQPITDVFVPGFYFYRASSIETGRWVMGRFVTY
jgi:hypothetical protein